MTVPRKTYPPQGNTMNSFLLLAVVFAAASDPADAYPDLHLIPWPKSLRLDTGHMRLSSESRIVAGDKRLQPLADVLSGEIALLTGLKLKVTTDEGRAGDIVLRIDSKLRAGERFGLIKFGSRTDVVLPAAARIQVKPGDRVRGGETVVGVLP